MRRLLAVFCLACLMLVALPVPAQLRTEGDVAGAQGLYEAEVPVASQADAEVGAGLGRALEQVLVQLTGDRQVAARPGVAVELRKARDYNLGYDFRQDRSTSPSGSTQFRTLLVARFRPEDVDAVAAMLGLPTWPQPRPKPVVWLAIDDGRGPRLVDLGHVNASRPLLDRASERGFKLGLPQGSAAEQAVVGAIWRQDTAAIARASSRYNPPMQLIGKLYRNAGGWKADWVFVDAGKVLDTWSSTHADARQAMASGADGTADALAKRYARVAEGGAAGVYRVTFSGVRTTDDYLRLSGTLQRLAVVRRVTPVRAAADVFEADLELLSGLAGFDRAAGNDAPFFRLPSAPGKPAVYRMK